MLIEFSAKPEELNGAQGNVLRDATSEMLRAHRRGHHLVIVERATAGWILDNVELSLADKSTLQGIFQDYTQNANLLHLSEIFLSIDVQKLTFPEWKNNRLIVGLHHIRDFEICEKSILICEDSVSDAKFYEVILEKIFLDEYGFPVNFEHRHGGGKQISAVFRDILSERRLIAAIVDSDRKTPGENHPEKYIKLERYRNESPWKGSFCLCLTCHEIENIVPINVIEKLPLSTQKSHVIDALKRIAVAEELGNIPNSQRFYLYFDLKNGAIGPENPWISSKLTMGGKIAYVGFGDNIVSQLLDSRDAVREMLTQMRRSAWRDVFLKDFTQIGWFGIAARRSIT